MTALAIAICIAIWLAVGALCAWWLPHAEEFNPQQRRYFA